MAFLEWSEKINLKVKEMDDEHKILISLMNDLYDMNSAKKSKPELLQKFKSLYEYTVQHFSDEEKYLEKINFPEIKSHKRIHSELLKTLTQHFTSYEKSPVPEITADVFRFLKVWLQAHIMGIDMKYAEFSRKAA